MSSVIRIDVVESEGGGEGKLDVQTQASTLSLHLKLFCLTGVGSIGIPCVAVKCVDIRRNTSGEGGLLDSN